VIAALRLVGAAHTKLGVEKRGVGNIERAQAGLKACTTSASATTSSA